MKISPFYFYQMSLRECSLAVNGHHKAIERDYNLAFMASYNAHGAIQGGKKFKIEHPFDENKKKSKKTESVKKSDDINDLIDKTDENNLPTDKNDENDVF